MDLLEQYKQQNPEAFQEKKPAQSADEYGLGHSGMIALVIRLSGGRISGTKQASYALFGATIVIALAAVLVFFGVLGFSSGAKPQYSTDPLHLPPALRQ